MGGGEKKKSIRAFSGTIERTLLLYMKGGFVLRKTVLSLKWLILASVFFFYLIHLHNSP